MFNFIYNVIYKIRKLQFYKAIVRFFLLGWKRWKSFILCVRKDMEE